LVVAYAGRAGVEVIETSGPFSPPASGHTIRLVQRVSRPTFFRRGGVLKARYAHMIVVLATIELHPGKRPQFLDEFRKIIPHVRGEQGCLEYFPAIDTVSGLAVQGPSRDDIVVVVEKWDSVAALETHLVAPHMMEYRPKVKDFVKKVGLQILSPAE
jgi:quinol monooxygenase YgiN